MQSLFDKAWRLYGKSGRDRHEVCPYVVIGDRLQKPPQGGHGRGIKTEREVAKPLFSVNQLGLEPRTPSLKGMCSTC